MAYETNKQNILSLIQQATGISRLQHPDLQTLSDQRAYEGFLEVGTGPQPDGSHKGISHPTQMELESRMGPTWAGKGVGEIAIWGYLLSSPDSWAVNGWMGSTQHRAVLVDPKYKYLNIGIYTWIPQNADEVHRRWYWIGTVSISAPTPPPPAEELIPRAQFSESVNFPVGQHIAYRFDTNGKILSVKKGSFPKTSRADAKAIGFIPGRNGVWTYITNGVFAGHWMRVRLQSWPNLEELV